jgi:hypothetical protein
MRFAKNINTQCYMANSQNSDTWKPTMSNRSLKETGRLLTAKLIFDGITRSRKK